MIKHNIIRNTAISIALAIPSTKMSTAEDLGICSSSESDNFDVNHDLTRCSSTSSDNMTNTSNNVEATADWREYSFVEIHGHLDCSEHVYRDNKPLYTPAMWARLRDAFAHQSGIDMGSSKLEETHTANYHSGYAEEYKGRGTFAARSFSKGELVHDGKISTVFWNDGLAWKEYVMSLPRRMACDVLEWTWIQEVQGYGWLLSLNLNDAAFMNHDENFNITIITLYVLYLTVFHFRHC
jgi:hypothetical protein